MDDVSAAKWQSVVVDDAQHTAFAVPARFTIDNELSTVTKTELAERLFEKVGLNKREAKEMVDAFFDEIRQALERGESVKLSGFGNFELRDKQPRPGRNPKTGDQVVILARRVVTFHASQKLKDLVGVVECVQNTGS